MRLRYGLPVIAALALMLSACNSTPNQRQESAGTSANSPVASSSSSPTSSSSPAVVSDIQYGIDDCVERPEIVRGRAIPCFNSYEAVGLDSAMQRQPLGGEGDLKAYKFGISVVDVPPALGDSGQIIMAGYRGYRISWDADVTATNIHWVAMFWKRDGTWSQIVNSDDVVVRAGEVTAVVNLWRDDRIDAATANDVSALPIPREKMTIRVR